MAFQMPNFLTRLMRPFSTSMSRPYVSDSLAAKEFGVQTERAIFAGGCFWGLEKFYRDDFIDKKKGVLDCRVGYTGGNTEDPSYRAVCSGRTGHAESLLVVFDPSQIQYRTLVEYFFRLHDPTQLNGQGMDIGTQYRSAVFTTTDEQLKIANEVKDKVGKQWYPGRTVTTQVMPAGKWYDAEDNHQDYLNDNPGGYECPMHKVRNFPELS